jgi:hypothetical protein
MRNRQPHWMAIVPLVALCLAGCDSVRSVQPLSNEETSRLDQRLIGGWDPVDGQKAEGTSTLWVGRKPGSKKALELVTVVFKEDQTIEAVRLPIFVRHGQANYLSLDPASIQEELPFGQKDDPGAHWCFCKYEMPDDHTVILYAPKLETLREAVRQGKLKGSLVKPRPFWLFGFIPVTGPAKGDVVLADSPEKIVAFLDKQKDGWMDEPMVFHKVPLSREPEWKKSTSQ